MAFTPQFSPGVQPLLVGRDREREVLTNLFAATRRGRGRLVLISGEAGIGKTALIEALTAEATAQSVPFAIGRCHDLTDTPPYGPWHELFQHAAQSAGFPPASGRFCLPRRRRIGRQPGDPLRGAPRGSHRGDRTAADCLYAR